MIPFENPPPHGLSLGNDSLSIRQTFNPFLAKYREAVEPAGPAPIIATSYMVCDHEIDFSSILHLNGQTNKSQ
jgi:hypothetical protein